MKKGRRFTAMLLAVLMLFAFAPATVKAEDQAATHVLSGIPENVTVSANGNPLTPTNGKVNVEAGSTVLVTPDDGWKIVSLRVTYEAATTHPNTAKVTLTVGDVWGDGTGYQMLLDADGTAFGTIIPETGALASGDVEASVYAEFEYKIPENADGSLTTSNIVLNDSVTIEIPGGTYDWCITNPTPGDRMWIASANGTVGGRYDDFVFENGKDYTFVVELGGNNDKVDLFASGEVVVTAETNGYSFEMPDADAVMECEVAEKVYRDHWDFNGEDQLDEQLEGWLLLDYDGDGENWGLATAGHGDYEPADENYALSSYSWYGDALTPDNWLISPTIIVPDKDATLTFWLLGNPNYPGDVLSVLVGPDSAVEETTIDTSAFVALGEDIVTTGEWVQHTYDLSNYAGTEIRLVFRHYNCTDLYWLKLDDIGIDGEFEQKELQLEVDKMGTDGIELSWNDLGADSYELYRGTEGFSVSDTKYVDNVGRTMGTEYTYVVKAVKDGEYVAESKPIDVIYNPFEDVEYDTPTFDHVAWAYNNSIVNGLSNNHYKFGVENLCRRSQFCYMLWRMAGSPSVSGSVPFEDIGDLSGNNKKALIWCYQQEIVNGTSPTTFAPSGDINRAQLAIMVWKMAGKPATTGMTCPYTDIDSLTANNKKAVIWCYNKGLIDSITGTKFEPKVKGNRALLCEMMYGLNLEMGLVPVDNVVETKLAASALNVKPIILTNLVKGDAKADFKVKD